MKRILLYVCLPACLAVAFGLTTHQMQTSFDKQGHRGCRGLMPENTIPAMLKAIDLGVTTLEMDVVITKDSQVVLSHEPFFSHEITTCPDGSFLKKEAEKSYNIYQMTYEEVSRYDVGTKPHPRFPRQHKCKAVKPLLTALIDTVEAYGKRSAGKDLWYNIETKSAVTTDGLYHPAPAAFVEAVMKVVQAKGIEKRTIIQSFDVRTLQYLHRHYPQIRTALLIEGADGRNLEEQLQSLGFVPNIYSPAFQLVNESLISACHAKSMQVIPWTVNEKGMITKLKAMGVDGVITDYPDLFD